ncbi:MAG: mechanosensitive ion channel family protein [Sedimentibacter sp.]|uniref:mechanosensitive ion channel family protein n=1 Tax=Sedimentibacter sp. TaxID=1960295 RepID=UPI002981253C|nr:mechanosensitive ion channel family protein [Sedimentibacter sp.]MDW5300211.1 mechanosensitive ion channel family protein [Sedimentibacter sp.]
MIFTSEVSMQTVAEAVIILFALLLFRNFITNIIIKILKKLSEKYNLKNIALVVDSIEKPLVNFFTFTGIYFALIVLPFNANIAGFINKVYRTFIIITLTQCGLNIVTAYAAELNNAYTNINDKKERTQMSKTVFPLVSKLIKVIIIVIAVAAIAVEFNFKQLSSILAGLGIGGAALALASQDLIKNFFGGFVILTDKSFSVGDWIRVDSFEGIVEELGLRSTKIRTVDKELVTVPNSRFADRELINYSARENRRANFTLGAVYDTPSDKLKNTIEKIKNMLDNHPMVKENSALVKFDKFSSSSLDIVVQYLTNTADYTEYMNIKNDINFKIIDIFNNEQVSFAFSSMSIYMENSKNL